MFAGASSWNLKAKADGHATKLVAGTLLVNAGGTGGWASRRVALLSIKFLLHANAEV